MSAWTWNLCSDNKEMSLFSIFASYYSFIPLKTKNPSPSSQTQEQARSRQHLQKRMRSAHSHFHFEEKTDNCWISERVSDDPVYQKAMTFYQNASTLRNIHLMHLHARFKNTLLNWNIIAHLNHVSPLTCKNTGILRWVKLCPSGLTNLPAPAAVPWREQWSPWSSCYWHWQWESQSGPGCGKWPSAHRWSPLVE